VEIGELPSDYEFENEKGMLTNDMFTESPIDNRELDYDERRQDALIEAEQAGDAEKYLDNYYNFEVGENEEPDRIPASLTIPAVEKPTPTPEPKIPEEIVPSWMYEVNETTNSTGTLDELSEKTLEEGQQVEESTMQKMFRRPSSVAATPTPMIEPTALTETAKAMGITEDELQNKELMEFIESDLSQGDVKRLSITLENVQNYGVKNGKPFIEYDNNIYTKNEKISKKNFIDKKLISDIEEFSKSKEGYQIKIDSDDIKTLWKEDTKNFSLKDQKKSIDNVTKHLTQAARAQLYVILEYAKKHSLPVRISNFENRQQTSATEVHPQGRGIDIGLNVADEFEKWTGMKKVQQHYIKDNKKINHILALNKLLKGIFKKSFTADMGALTAHEAYRDIGDGKFEKIDNSHIHTQTQHAKRMPASKEHPTTKWLFNKQNEAF
jgi:hypothetical protein